MTKRLVICCDGTWNTADMEIAGRPCPSNIAKIALSVAAEDSAGVEQRVRYQVGVGTTRWERVRGGAFGFGLSRNVIDVYRFLVDNYDHGDELYFFGFSRGAHTARSLAGLVRNSGVLRRENASRVQEAWNLYRSATEKPTGVASALFRRAYAYEPRIRFLGMFDTVGALGVPVLGPGWLKPVVRRINRRWEFHDTTLSSLVDGAFHAVAIDEKRAVFEPTLWHQQAGVKDQEMRQVWFTGVHCDVGGGYPETSLSDVALLWMIDRARAYGLEFKPLTYGPGDPPDPKRHTDFTVAPAPMTPPHDSWTTVYRLVSPVNRKIGEVADEDTHRVDGNEYVASTAKEYFDGGHGYRPPELDAYLKTPAAREEPVEIDLD